MTDEPTINNDKPVDEIEDLRLKLAESKKKAEECMAGWKRATADYQNIQKEISRDRENFAKFANERLISEFLPVLANAKQAFSNIPQAQGVMAEWIKGVGHVFDGFKTLLRTAGVEEMKTVGEKFNPELHEAVLLKKEEGTEEGIILVEIRPGYLLHGKVLRPAQVIVSE